MCVQMDDKVTGQQIAQRFRPSFSARAKLAAASSPVQSYTFCSSGGVYQSLFVQLEQSQSLLTLKRSFYLPAHVLFARTGGTAE